MTDCTIDQNQATQFLTTLDSNATHFCFQQMSDRDDKALPVVHLQLSELNKLNRKARNKYGTFITINPVEINERRTSSNVTGIRAIYADDDNVLKQPREDWPLKPSIVVESSKGKYHYYWLLLSNGLDASVEHSELLKKHIAANYHTDAAGVRGSNRVLRLPGYPHNKKSPFTTSIVSINDNKYTISQLDKAFNFSHHGTLNELQSEIQSDSGLLDTLEIIRQTNEGEYHVICPFADEHSNPDDNRANFLFAGTGKHSSDTFHCHHDSCSHRGIDDIWELSMGQFVDDLPIVQVELFTHERKVPVLGELFTSFSESLLNDNEPEWWVEGLMPKNATCIAYGDSGSKKTFWAISQGLHIAQGKAFNGCFTEKGAVFYIASEGEGGIDHRLQAHMQQFNDDPATPFYSSKVPARLDNIEHMNDLNKEIDLRCKTLGDTPALIVIDTLSASSGSLSTNDNDDMAQMIALCDDMRRKLKSDTSILIIHHTGHGNKDRMRGASSLHGNVHAAWLIESDEDIVTITGKKMKDDQLTPEHYFTSRFIELGRRKRTGTPYGSLVLLPGDISPAESLSSKLGLGGVKAEAFEILYSMGACSESVDIDDWRHRVQDAFAASTHYKSEDSAIETANRAVRDVGEIREVKKYKNKVKIKA